MEYRVVSSVSWQQRADVWWRAADDYTHLQACSGVKLPADISGWFLCGAREKSFYARFFSRFPMKFMCSSALNNVISPPIFFSSTQLSLRPNSPQKAWLPGCGLILALRIYKELKLDISVPWYAVIQWMCFVGILVGVMTGIFIIASCGSRHDVTNGFFLIIGGGGKIPEVMTVLTWRLWRHKGASSASLIAGM